MPASHLKALSIKYVDLCKYVEAAYPSKPGDPDYDAEETIYNSWIEWVDKTAERTAMLGEKVKKKSKIFDGYANKLEISFLLNLQDLTVAQLQSCPVKLKELLDAAIQQQVHYLIVIVPWK